ncbi:hypothetical protein T484DRAFT_1777266 [Baffinella frigidus]|nr:hypothetical protein T484DRAFT_1777266 [Cryptophyta sp. CCMP2293]
MGGTGSAGSFSGAWRYAALIFLVGACMVGGDDGADPAADSPLLVLPTFEAAMGERPLKWGWWSPDDRAWVPVLEDLYNRHLREPAVVGGDDGSEALSDVRIPRIIHQVWLGGDPLPAQFQAR